MDEEALSQWIDERLAQGEDATVYEFIREVLDKGHEREGLLSSAQAKITEHENSLAERDAEIARLKAHNYDLLMQVPSGEEVEENEGDGKVIENVEEDGEIIHIDNLFADDEKEDE